MTGRRGAVVHALGAIDMALWDICGKAAGVPTWQLLGEKARESFRPYASLLPKADGDFDEFSQTLVDQAPWAKGLGFRAAKLEILITGPYATPGSTSPDGRMIETIAGVRRRGRPGLHDHGRRRVRMDERRPRPGGDRELGRLDVFFVETPLWADDLEGYAELARRSPTPIAAGEWLATRFEFIDLMDRGGVQVAQPDVGRVGGLTEARRVCDLAAERGRLIVPHGWKTGITIAATAHLAAVTPHMPFFEYVPQQVAESRLRRELVTDELVLVDGELALPARPGLGVELNRDVLDEFEQAAKRVRR